MPPDFLMAALKCIYLLPEAEITDLYARLLFNQNEQRLYFEMNRVGLDKLSQLGSFRTLWIN
ncbi:hypothetical protein SK355_12140 (plasmid) [Candidatus Fukatsuia symbiotica]|uniref:Uncharacterized protein n=2 Tax=Candidatus Fukatsuia symbiotica TaxID=1878942 RepID=A0A2U8I8U3_9GAMM|nr:hypothetical protein [Candidatus Fukatsuia symbiotica]AWK15533.1 hypothetical protein CCS41_13990 [Candidatus Fukatsuia symbiotica]MEA9445924.1 hypothetical protein [Candidatus Fukatsuia symbiotica]